VMIPPTPVGQSRIAETELPSLPDPSVSTSYGLDSSVSTDDPSIYVQDAVEKPTTLTSAASESVISRHGFTPRKSRKGALIALLSVATVAAAAVVVFKVTRDDHNAGPARQPIVDPAPKSAPPERIDIPPKPQPKPEPPIVEPKPEPTPEPAGSAKPDKPKPTGSGGRPRPTGGGAKKPPATGSAKPPDKVEVKPDKKPCKPPECTDTGPLFEEPKKN